MVPLNKNRVADRLRDLARVYEPYLTPSQRCEQNIILPPGKNEAMPGRIVWEKTPYLRQILDCLEDPAVRTIVFIAPTRSGKTLLLRLVIAMSIAKTPCPTLLFDSTIEKGRLLVRKEIKPLINYNSILSSRKPKNKAHFADAHMLFSGASLDVYGANSAAGAAGDTAVRVVGNEIGKWRGETDYEASMIELIKHRIESAEGEGKVYLSTTPTTDDADEWQEFLRGDQCKFHVPCPHCGQMQELKWTNVHWDPEAKITETEWDYAKVKATACIQCAHCAAFWTEEERLSAIRDRRSTWVPSAQAKIPGTRSFQISGLYGPLQSNTPGEIAVAFLASRQTGWFSSRRDFWNSRMGEPYHDSITTITAEKFKSVMADYHRGTLPADFKADVVIIAVDVQSNRLPWVCMGLNYAGEKRTIDHGDAQTWSDIDQIQRAYGRLAPESFVAVDVGFGQRSAETLEAIHMRKNVGWLGVRGVEQSAELTKLQKVDPFLGTRQEGAAQIPVIQISTYEFKVEWEKRFTREIDSWRTYTLPEGASEQLVHEQGEYFAQLLDEHRVPRKRILAGKPTWEWRSRSANNHSFDCHVYILAVYYFLSRSRTIERTRYEAARPPKRRQYAAS